MPPLRPYDKAPYPAKSYGSRGLTLPFSRNIGPFNSVNRPTNRFDNLALRHDLATDFSYYLHNPADERLFQRSKFLKPKNTVERFHKAAIEAWHSFKKKTFRWSDSIKVPSRWRSSTAARGGTAAEVRARRVSRSRISGGPRAYSAVRSGRGRFIAARRRRGGRRRRRRFARS